MKESNLYNVSNSGNHITYKEETYDTQFSMTFNLDTKTVDVSLQIFISNGTPMLEPQNLSDWIKHSAKYGHWQQIHPTLSVDDIEFMYAKMKELF